MGDLAGLKRHFFSPVDVHLKFAGLNISGNIHKLLKSFWNDLVVTRGQDVVNWLSCNTLISNWQQQQIVAELMVRAGKQLIWFSPERPGVLKKMWKMCRKFQILLSQWRLCSQLEPHTDKCPWTDSWYKDTHTQERLPSQQLMSGEIPGMVSQRLEKVVIWVFPPDEVAKCDSAYFRFTTKLPNLWPVNDLMPILQ